MAGTTTYYGISYPTSTDYVKDGATAMQTIATGFDSAVAIPTYNNQTGTTYTFVLADTGKTVTSNNASAVTFTIPPQVDVAWANNATLTVRNLGAGVVTIAGGAGVTVTNTAQTVEQYGEVKLIRTASNAWTVVPASGSASGLSLITEQTFSASSAVNVNNVFTSTYTNYKLLISATGGSATSANFNLRYRLSGTDASGSNYARQFLRAITSTVSGSFDTLTETNIGDIQSAGTLLSVVEIFSPAVAVPTRSFASFNGYTSSSTNNYVGFFANVHTVSTAYDGFSLIPSASTATGTVWVYGYEKA